MNHALFTVEEENLICAFDTSSRTALMADIKAIMPDFCGDEPEMQEIVNNVLRKLDDITDTEFSELVFSPVYY